MKKIIYSSLFFITAMVLMNSCQNEQVLESENLNDMVQETEEVISSGEDFDRISIEKNTLIFETIEYYDYLMNHKNRNISNEVIEYVNNSGFQSFRKLNKGSENFGDEFIESILDGNRIVRIGEWFIKINPMEEKVLVINQDIKNAYELLVREKEGNAMIYTFSTADNVLEYLAHPEEMENKGLFCGDSGVGSRSSQSYFSDLIVSGNRIILEHRKYGVWFKLQTRMYVETGGFNATVKLNYSIKKYKKTCKDLVSLPTGIVTYTIGVGNTNVISYGTRNYNKYHIKADAKKYNVYNGTLIGSTGIVEIRVNM